MSGDILANILYNQMVFSKTVVNVLVVATFSLGVYSLIQKGKVETLTEEINKLKNAQ